MSALEEKGQVVSARDSTELADPKVIKGIRYLAKIVLETCQDQGEYPSPLVCEFLVRCYALSRGDTIDFRNGDKLPESQMRSLISNVTEKIFKVGDPEVETIKLQVCFESHYAAEMLAIRRRRKSAQARKQGLVDRVVETGSSIKSNTQVASLYRSLFKLLLEDAGVRGHQVNRKIERELAAALESVFPQSNLVNFNNLKSKQKREHIDEMSRVVIGIRLFNREMGKGGFDIEDIPKVTLVEAKELSSKIEDQANSIEKKATKLQSVLDFEHTHPGSISSSVDRLQIELANRRQMLLLLNQLLHECLLGVENIRVLNAQMRNVLEQLKNLVGGKSAVPKETVYPQFVELAKIWASMENERELVRMRKKVNKEIEPFVACFRPSLLPSDLKLARDVEAKEAKNEASREGKIKTLNETLEVETIDTTKAENARKAFSRSNTTPYRLIKKSTPDFMTLPLEFQGYCPYTIVSQGGQVVAGSPEVGIIVYKGSFYTFRAMDQLIQFSKDPEKYLSRITSLVQKKPYLAHLLCLQDRIPNFAIPHFFLSDGVLLGSSSGASARDVATQTPTHFSEPHKDSKYTWNEWELRRRALQMTNLTNKHTTSAQTDKSHFRRDNGTQHSLPKPYADGSMPGKGSQTRKSQGTNVPITKKYMAGLRGKPNTKFKEKTCIFDGVNIVSQS